MNVIVVGNGGREHAIADKISQSQFVKKIFVCPGNGGTDRDFINVQLNEDFKKELLKLIQKENIEFVVIGPEQYLVDGLVDFLTENNIKSFGADSYCAQLEGSKIFAKEVMQKCQVPTADYRIFSDYEKAKEFLISAEEDYVLKADGLCAGKGVIVPKDK